MDRNQIKNSIQKGRLRWQRHALQRMMERGISRSDVKHILLQGEIIEHYPDDHPLPSALFLGFVNDKPLHVVAAIDSETNWCYIITAYRPDTATFENDFKTRK